MLVHAPKESVESMIQHIFREHQTPNIILAALEGHSARHQAIINNIANVDTPGYRRVEVTFEEQLAKEIDRMRPKRKADESVVGVMEERPLGRFSPKASVDMSSPIRFDGSNVQIDREMVDLAETSGKLTQLTELLIRQQRMVRSAILGRNA